MDYATKFCLLFCVTSVFCSASEALNNTENNTSESSEIDCDDFCRLRYHANDTVLILKPGEYDIDSDGILYIELSNSTLNRTLFEVWSNDSEANISDCKIRYDSWQFALVAHMTSLIALHMCLTLIVVVNDPVKLIEFTAFSVFYIFALCILFVLVKTFDCPQTHLAFHGIIHYASLTWVFWKSSAVFDAFINQVAYHRVLPGGPNDDIRLTNQNVIRNFAIRMIEVVIISTILHVIGIPYIVGEDDAECGIPRTTMYLTFTRSVIAYVIVGFLNFLAYRRFLVGRRVPTELLLILKDLCDLDFMFFVILAFTWFIGCFTSAGYFAFYASTIELGVYLVLLFNFLHYCYSINWHGGFV